MRCHRNLILVSINYTMVMLVLLYIVLLTESINDVENLLYSEASTTSSSAPLLTIINPSSYRLKLKTSHTNDRQVSLLATSLCLLPDKILSWFVSNSNSWSTVSRATSSNAPHSFDIYVLSMYSLQDNVFF